MNWSIICCTSCRQPFGRRCELGLGPLSHTLSSRSSVSSSLLSGSGRSAPDSSRPCCTTMNRPILITADNIGGYCSGPFQPSSLTPSTARAHINGLSYSRRVIQWSSNAIQKSKHAFWSRLNCSGLVLVACQPGTSWFTRYIGDPGYRPDT
jgi:hypothetical protein